jgi:hypothetical protein
MDGISGVRSGEAASIDDVSASDTTQPSASQHDSSIEAHPASNWESDHMSSLREFRNKMGPAVASLARDHEDPSSLTDNDARHSAFGKAVYQLRTTLGSMNDGAVAAEMEDAVRRAWPNATPEDAHAGAARLTDQVREQAKYDAAFGMRDTAVEVMRNVGEKLDKLSKDPKELGALAQRLREMPKDREEALRAKLGLEDAKLEPKDMSAKIGERAKLLQREAKELSHADSERVFRAMSGHHVSETFMSQRGISPDSLAGRQVLVAREQGKSDKENIETMKRACTYTAAFFSGGLAAGGIAAGMMASAAASFVMNSGSVSQKYREIDTARAGVSAGTMSGEAIKNAKFNFGVAATIAAAEGLSGGLLAHHTAEPIEDMFLHVAGDSAAKFLAHGIAETAVTFAANSAEQALSREDE